MAIWSDFRMAHAAWGSIETMTMGKTHPTLRCESNGLIRHRISVSKALTQSTKNFVQCSNLTISGPRTPLKINIAILYP